MAHVFELLKVKMESDRRRDFYPAAVWALLRNVHRAEEDKKVYSAFDILQVHYKVPDSPESVIITGLDAPERGAGGDWKALRSSLKKPTRRKRA